MPKYLIPILSLCLVACGAEEPQTNPEPADTKAADEQAVTDFSRAVGLFMGTQAKDMGLDEEAVLAGIAAAYAGEERPDNATMQKLESEFRGIQDRPLQDLSNKIIARTDITSSGADWKQAQGLPASTHDDFYAAFIAMDGVTVTKSGLAYHVLEDAEGAKPKASDTVSVHYVGRHTTGEIFDSSIGRGSPTSFPLGNVIKGWTEGVQLMPTGSTYRFVIPGNLAYGPLQEGSGRPTGVLIFDVTLLKIR